MLCAHCIGIDIISFHYENMPIQMYWKFYNPKMKIFR